MKTSQGSLILIGCFMLVSILGAYFWCVNATPNVDIHAAAILVPTEDLQIAVPGNEAAVVSRAETLAIKEELVTARKQLQTNVELAEASPESVHHTPGLILAAATKLAEVMDLEASYPQNKPEFQAFYADCAHDSAVITVTRAQCLKRYIDSARPAAEVQEQLLSELPSSVVRLFKNL